MTVIRLVSWADRAAAALHAAGEYTATDKKGRAKLSRYGSYVRALIREGKKYQGWYGG